MYAELVAILVCTAASSYATYELVTRHLSVHFDEVLQELKKAQQQAKELAAVLDTRAKARIEELKQTHFDAVEQHVKAEVAKKLGVLDSDICSFCKSHVVKFERLADGVVKCLNCKNGGK
jgi:hypothetical protein